MNLSQKVNRSFAADIAAGAGTTVIIAAPGAGKNIRISKFHIHVVATAAQTATFGDGTSILARLGTSEPLGSNQVCEFPNNGFALAANAAFSYTPSAAGYAVVVTGEYYIEGSTPANP